MIEKWKPIPEYGGLYEASSLGRIRSVDRIVSTYSARARRPAQQRRKGRILALSVGPHGYLLVCLSKNGKAKTRRVNVLVCSAFHGPRAEGEFACHNDGNKTNNRPDNLRWDTPKANQADRHMHGTALAGEAIATAKLSPADVRAIRAAESFGDVADINVSRTHFYRIKRGDAWTHI